MTLDTNVAQSRRWQLLVSTLALLLFFGLAVNVALQKSQTVDEYVHIVRGYALWTTDDLRLQTQPPLSHWLIGAPLLTAPDLPSLPSLDSWATADRPSIAYEWLWQRGVDVRRILFLSRLAIIFVGLLTGAVLVRWARALWGGAGGLMAALLFALSPNLLALSTLATTDMTVTATYTTAVFALWWYWQRPSRWRWLLAGIGLGLALAAKLTALLLLPLLLPLCYLHRRRSEPWWRPALVYASIVAVAGVVLWSVYLFDVGRVPGIPIPVPLATYLDNFIRVQTHVGDGHRAFLLGDLSHDGWYHYFLVTFLIKTPMVTLLLLAAAAVYLFKTGNVRRTAFLWLPAGALFVVASAMRLNIGYRHILPMLPFLLVLAAAPAAWLWSQRRARWLLAAGVLWYGIAGLRQAPDYLAYFNEFVGGSEAGYRYLGDSNLDWGQDLYALLNFAATADRPVYVSYFGVTNFDYFDFDATQLYDDKTETAWPGFAPANPAPGLYAISASHAQGLNLPDSDLFDWFWRREPVAQLGHSILIYEVPTAKPGDWIGHCIDPVSILDEATAVSLLGVDSARHVYFDCNRSWVFPPDGRPGWYILPHRQEPWPVESVLSLPAVPDYVNKTGNPWYEVVHWPGGDVTALAPVQREAALADGTAVSLPATVDGMAQLAGFAAAGETWATLWQVVAPTDAPLTVAGHLYADAPTPVVADGLGYSVVQWQPGDVFVQFHNFESGANGRFLETGLYNYATGERYPYADVPAKTDILRLYPNGQ